MEQELRRGTPAPYASASWLGPGDQRRTTGSRPALLRERAGHCSEQAHPERLRLLLPCDWPRSSGVSCSEQAISHYRQALDPALDPR